eukprot:1188578-Prorocentrum_minimum.AAC.2
MLRERFEKIPWLADRAELGAAEVKSPNGSTGAAGGEGPLPSVAAEVKASHPSVAAAGAAARAGAALLKGAAGGAAGAGLAD